MWTPFKGKGADKTLEHLNDKLFYRDTMDRYIVTKLLSVFWARELASCVPSEQVVNNVPSPGNINTGLHRDSKAFSMFDRVVGRTLEEGGWLVLDAASVKGSDAHGEYLSDARLTEYADHDSNDTS